MNKQFIKQLLEEAYEAGFYGPLDLKDSVVDSLIQEWDSHKSKGNSEELSLSSILEKYKLFDSTVDNSEW